VPTRGSEAPRDELSSSCGSDSPACPGDFVSDFQASAVRCSGLADLKQLLQEHTQDLGLSCFALLHHRALAQPGANHIRIDTYPLAWADELVTDHLSASPDPVHQACARTMAVFDWSELPRLIPLTRGQHRLIERSRRHGLSAGLTVPVHDPGSQPLLLLRLARGYCADPALRAMLPS
jgi:hypothetical protein